MNPEINMPTKEAKILLFDVFFLLHHTLKTMSGWEEILERETSSRTTFQWISFLNSTFEVSPAKNEKAVCRWKESKWLTLDC